MAIPLDDARLNAITQKDHFEQDPHCKPDFPYYYEEEVQESGFVDYPHECELDPEPMPDLIWGRFGYKVGSLPPLPVAAQRPPNHTNDPDDTYREWFKKAYKVAAYLKRAWEYPYIMEVFANNPGAYLISDFPVGVNAGDWKPSIRLGPEDLHELFTPGENKGTFDTVDQAAVAIGMLTPGQGPELNRNDAPRVVLQMIHLLHGNYIPWQVGCK